MIYLACGAFVVFGLLCIFAKDFLWDLTQMRNERNGVASERTDAWERSTTIGGVVAVVVGIAVSILAFVTALPH